MPSVKTPVTWSQMKAPTTAKQRIAFLDACQKEFETVRALGPTSGRLLVRTRATGPSAAIATGAEAACSLHTFTAVDNFATALLDPTCYVCKHTATSATCANPLSDWYVVLCATCQACVGGGA